MSAALHRLLESFASSHEFTGNKGPLCVALVVTRMAVRHGLPLEASELVTTAPTRQLLGKCSANLERGLRPLVISSQAGAALAESLAEEMGIGRRVEVLEITQFLVANMLERTAFQGSSRRSAMEEFITHYNDIVDRCETDPGMKIEVA